MADDLLIANAPAPPAVLGPKQFLTQHSEQYRRQYNLADPACVNAEELSANVKLEAAPPAPKPADTTWVLPLVQEAQSKGKKRECSWCKNPMWQGKERSHPVFRVRVLGETGRQIVQTLLGRCHGG